MAASVLAFALTAFAGCSYAENIPAVSTAPSLTVQSTAAPDSISSISADDTVSRTYRYDIRELASSRDGKNIYGIVYIPQDAGDKMPAVIYSHGLGGTHTSGADYAAALAENGYVVYCFDFCGGSSASRSDGSTLEMSIFTEQADLEAALHTVQALNFVDDRNIFLLGTSQGGAVSAITGAANADAIRGMILLYPAFSLVEDAKAQYSSLEEVPQSSTLLWLTVGREYYASLLDYNIYSAVSTYAGDVLIMCRITIEVLQRHIKTRRRMRRPVVE